MAPLATEDSAPLQQRSLRRVRGKSTIDSTILSPGTVKINFQGAFILDDSLSIASHEDGAQCDTKDIRLPNNRAVVSHVALDASLSLRAHLPSTA